METFGCRKACKNLNWSEMELVPGIRIICIYYEHRSVDGSWNRRFSTSRQCALQMHGVTSIFGVRRWNQVQNVRAQCSHLSTFLKKCSDQNWRYAPRKTCILTVLVHFGILRQALPRPFFGRRMRSPKPVQERNGGVEGPFRYTEAGFNAVSYTHLTLPTILRV